MINFFKKHKEDYQEIDDLLWDLSIAISQLRQSVNELREELDFLIDELDD